MNERIRELSEQAGWIDDKQFSTRNKLYQWQNFDKEKFAELIVRECAGVMQENVNLNYDYCLDQKILKHFGVENV